MRLALHTLNPYWQDKIFVARLFPHAFMALHWRGACNLQVYTGRFNDGKELF